MTHTLLDKTFHDYRCRAVFFYTIKGDRFSFPLCNAISPMNGSKADEDFCKKLETNTISKALSKLGFSADVFMGKFENEDYLSNLKIETSIDKAENKDSEIEKQRKECENFVISHFEAIERAVTINEAQGLYRTSIRSLERQKTIPAISSVCERGIVKIHKTFETKKGELDAEVV